MLSDAVTANELIKLKRYVVGFAFTPTHSHVLLINKKRPKEQVGLSNGFGGRIELGETPVQAMVRETYEETALSSSKDDWFLFHYERHSSGTCLYFYVTNVLNIDTARQTTDESLRVLDMDFLLQSAPTLMYNLPYLLLMAKSYIEHPQHRYLEG